VYNHDIAVFTPRSLSGQLPAGVEVVASEGSTAQHLLMSGLDVWVWSTFLKPLFFPDPGPHTRGSDCIWRAKSEISARDPLFIAPASNFGSRKPDQRSTFLGACVSPDPEDVSHPWQAAKVVCLARIDGDACARQAAGSPGEPRGRPFLKHLASESSCEFCGARRQSSPCDFLSL
jgi:hypothetical protein